MQSSDDEISIRQIKSGAVFHIPVKIMGKEVSAVVDTAAEVNLISDSFLIASTHR